MIGSNIGKVFNCYAVNNVTASTSGKDAVVGRSSCQIGGLVGENGYMIFNCYATGDVHGEGSNAYCYAGGLIGYNADTTEGTRVFFCYASGNVYSEYKGSNGNALAGGFVGHDRGQYASSIIEDCYAVGDDNVTIIIKNVPNDTTLNHRTLEISPDEALTVTFFTDLGWMDDVWIITEGEDPTLYIFTTF